MFSNFSFNIATLTETQSKSKKHGFNFGLSKWIIFTVFLILMLHIRGTESTAKVFINFEELYNPSSLQFDGSCCDGELIDANCTGVCDYSISVCLGESEDLPCSLTTVNLGYLDYHSEVFTFPETFPDGFANPAPFSLDSWPGSTLVTVYIHDQDTADRELIDTIQFRYFMPDPVRDRFQIPSDFVSLNLNGTREILPTRLQISVTTRCDRFYYNDTCDVNCVDTEDCSGHYSCNTTNGEKICSDGWGGPDCTDPITPDQGCSATDLCSDRGTCVTFGNETYQNYYCCCNDGYTGESCQKDIDECESNPCLNDGLCIEGSPPNYTCQCSKRWKGEFCETATTCDDNPCENGGRCQSLTVTSIETFYCLCDESRFIGEYCEAPVTTTTTESPTTFTTTSETTETSETTTHATVSSESTTIAPGGSPRACSKNYYGSNCLTYCKATDSCSGHYSCDETTGEKICMSGWTQESNCTAPVNPETQCACQNGGICFNDTCCCTKDFMGPACAEPAVFCPTDPCMNGGTCLEDSTGARCECREMFTGEFCQTMRYPNRNCQENYYGPDCDNFCQPQGQCGTTDGRYSCNELTGERVCLFGWTGEKCDQPDLDAKHDGEPCPYSVCRNSGTCVNQTCCCPPGFTGSLCHIEILECDSNPCLNNAICIDEINDYTCICKEEFYGRNCEEQIDTASGTTLAPVPDPCSNVQCQNEGTCLKNGTDSFICLCTDRYRGRFCENYISQGATNSNCPQNFYGEDCAVFCVEQNSCIGHYYCDPANGDIICMSGWEGDFCHERIAQIEADPECPSLGSGCLNGGSCFNGSCCCPLTHEGKMCEREILPCSRSPCGENTTCLDKEFTYECQCLPGYSDENCVIPGADNTMSLSPSATSAFVLSGSLSLSQGTQSIQPSLYSDTPEIRPTLVITPSMQTDSTGLSLDVSATRSVESAFNTANPSIQVTIEATDAIDGLTSSLSLVTPISQMTSGLATGIIDESNTVTTIQPTTSSLELSSSMSGSSVLPTTAPPSQNYTCENITCQNGGTCMMENDTQYICLCPDRYVGLTCENFIRETSSNTYCSETFYGNNCSVQCIEEDSCNGHFYCHHDNGERICKSGWSGSSCNERIVPVQIDPECPAQDSGCQNGGSCFNGTCCCTSSYTGPSCREEHSNCSSSPCGQFGVCVDIASGYLCQCVAGYSGRRCETRIDGVGNPISSLTSMPSQVLSNAGSLSYETSSPAIFASVPEMTTSSSASVGGFERTNIPPMITATATLLASDSLQPTQSTEYMVQPSMLMSDSVISTASTTPSYNDPCVGVTCENGGTCIGINDNNFICLCAERYRGFTCGIYVTEFAFNPNCPSSFYGDDCSVQCTEENSCNGHYYCDPANGSKLCRSGWIGVNCDQRVVPPYVDPECPADGSECPVGSSCFRGSCCFDGTTRSPVLVPSMTAAASTVAIQPTQSAPGIIPSSMLVSDSVISTASVTPIYNDPCSGVTCENGGTCIGINDNNFICLCAERYRGFTCGIYVTEFAFNPNCPSSFYGDDCSVQCTEENSCNGHYYCDPANGSKLCRSGWIGVNCDQRVVPPVVDPECPADGSECPVGSSCFRGSCCFDGTTRSPVLVPSMTAAASTVAIQPTQSAQGIIPSSMLVSDSVISTASVTSIYNDPCSGVTCENGGTCIGINDNNFICLCAERYRGFTCGIYVTEFAFNPNCPSSFYGDDCSVQCTEENSCNGHYYCDPANGSKLCRSGWIGVNCDQRVVPPVVDPECPADGSECPVGSSCFRGSCCFDGTTRSPVLVPSMTAAASTVAIQPTQSAPGIIPSSMLVSDSVISTASVTPIYNDPCLGVTCENGGTCIGINDNNFICLCAERYRGLTCGIYVTEFAFNPNCPSSFYGDDCSVQCTEENSCNGHYYCDPANGSKLCRSGWIGVNCDQRVVPPFVDPECPTDGSECPVGSSCFRGSCCFDGTTRGPVFVPSVTEMITGLPTVGLEGTKIQTMAMPTESIVPSLAMQPSESTQFMMSSSIPVTGSVISTPTTAPTYSDPCSNITCENGGTCIRSTNDDYLCLCPVRYEGLFCEIFVSQIPTNTNCPPTYYGDDCLVQCVEEDSCNGHYYCNPDNGAKICHPGWDGLNCDQRSVPPQVDPECPSGQYECPTGTSCFRGNCCVDGTTSSPVLLPSVTEMITGLSSLTLGFERTDLQTMTGATASFVPSVTIQPSQSTQYMLPSSMSVGDSVLFTPSTTPTYSDPCANTSCENGGNCIRINNEDFICLCADRYVGRFCEIFVPRFSFNINCPTSFYGDNCTVRCVEENSCSGHFYCNHTDGGTICRSGWDGLNCAERIVPPQIDPECPPSGLQCSGESSCFQGGCCLNGITNSPVLLAPVTEMTTGSPTVGPEGTNVETMTTATASFIQSMTIQPSQSTQYMMPSSMLVSDSVLFTPSTTPTYSDPCSNITCENGGTCIRSTNDEYICLCPVRYGGLLCEIFVSQIPTNTNCPPTYYGDICSVQCVEEDSCNGHYYCNPDNGAKICYPGWDGFNCEQRIILQQVDPECPASGLQCPKESSCFQGNCCYDGTTRSPVFVASMTELMTGLPTAGLEGTNIETMTTATASFVQSMAIQPSQSTQYMMPSSMLVSDSVLFTPSTTPTYSDPCSNITCENGGTCISSTNDEYICLCPVRYGGLLCEIFVSQIPTNTNCPPTYYGDVCSVQCVEEDSCNGHYYCNPDNGAKICYPGWDGLNCEQRIIPQQVDPECPASGLQCPKESSCFQGNCCYDGTTRSPVFVASMTELMTGLPTAGLEGTNIETMTTATASFVQSMAIQPSQSTQYMMPSSMLVSDSVLFTPSTTPTYNDPCSNITCENGGTCIRSTNDEYICLCPVRYGGLLCEIFVSQIPTNPNCPPTYYGEVCSVQCVEEDSCNGHYYCNPDNGAKICHPGWYGLNCDQRTVPSQIDPECPSGQYECPTGTSCFRGNCCVDGTTSSPVLLPSVTEMITGLSSLTLGFERTDLQTMTGATASFVPSVTIQPSQSTQYMLPSSMSVSDPVIFTPSTTPTFSDPCANTSCENGGNCIRINNEDFICLCADRYVGRFCEIFVPRSSFNINCPTSFYGDNCSVRCVEENSCSGHFYCNHTDGGTICRSGWDGLNCAERIVPPHVDPECPTGNSECPTESSCFRGSCCFDGITSSPVLLPPVTEMTTGLPTTGLEGTNVETMTVATVSFVPSMTIQPSQSTQYMMPSSMLVSDSVLFAPSTTPTYDSCSNITCENGGTCISSTNDEYICLCPERFEGLLCEIFVSQIPTNTNCPPTYYGDDCLVQCVEEDSCNGHYYCNPENGAIICRPGWNGLSCTERTIPSDVDPECPRNGRECPSESSCFQGVCCLNGTVTTPVLQMSVSQIIPSMSPGIQVSSMRSETLTTRMDSTIIFATTYSSVEATQVATSSAFVSESDIYTSPAPTSTTIYSSPCLNVTCLNGGTCVDDNADNFTCLCEDRFDGNLCENYIMDINLNPNCPAFYYGSNCSVQCEEKNSCEGHYYCDPASGAKICRSGWRGSFCDERTIDAKFDPECPQDGSVCATGSSCFQRLCCFNGTSVPAVLPSLLPETSYATPTVTTGLEISTMETMALSTTTSVMPSFAIQPSQSTQYIMPSSHVATSDSITPVTTPSCNDPCANITCENGGTCIRNSPDDFICLCTERYVGIFCENFTVQVLNGPSCPENFYGNDCSVQCIEENSCTGHYYCNPDTGAKICRSGWGGFSCDQRLVSPPVDPECSELGSICLNDGTCFGGSCCCPYPYTGTHCEQTLSLDSNIFATSTESTLFSTGISATFSLDDKIITFEPTSGFSVTDATESYQSETMATNGIVSPTSTISHTVSGIIDETVATLTPSESTAEFFPSSVLLSEMSTITSTATVTIQESTTTRTATTPDNVGVDTSTSSPFTFVRGELYITGPILPSDYPKLIQCIKDALNATNEPDLPCCFTVVVDERDKHFTIDGYQLIRVEYKFTPTPQGGARPRINRPEMLDRVDQLLGSTVEFQPDNNRVYRGQLYDPDNVFEMYIIGQVEADLYPQVTAIIADAWTKKNPDCQCTYHVHLLLCSRYVGRYGTYLTQIYYTVTKNGVILSTASEEKPTTTDLMTIFNRYPSMYTIYRNTDTIPYNLHYEVTLNNVTTLTSQFGINVRNQLELQWQTYFQGNGQCASSTCRVLIRYLRPELHYTNRRSEVSTLTYFTTLNGVLMRPYQETGPKQADMGSALGTCSCQHREAYYVYVHGSVDYFTAQRVVDDIIGQGENQGQIIKREYFYDSYNNLMTKVIFKPTYYATQLPSRSRSRFQMEEIVGSYNLELPQVGMPKKQEYKLFIEGEVANDSLPLIHDLLKESWVENNKVISPDDITISILRADSKTSVTANGTQATVVYYYVTIDQADSSLTNAEQPARELTAELFRQRDSFNVIDDVRLIRTVTVVGNFSPDNTSDVKTLEELLEKSWREANNDYRGNVSVTIHSIDVTNNTDKAESDQEKTITFSIDLEGETPGMTECDLKRPGNDVIETVFENNDLNIFLADKGFNEDDDDDFPWYIPVGIILALILIIVIVIVFIIICRDMRRRDSKEIDNNPDDFGEHNFDKEHFTMEPVAFENEAFNDLEQGTTATYVVNPELLGDGKTEF